MNDIEYTFARYEKKYILTISQYDCLRRRLEAYMEEDIYGLHTVCNIYCDTPSYELIRRSLRKPEYKEKFRFRSYGVPGRRDPVFAEIKKKCTGIVYKRRIAIESADTDRVLLGETEDYGQIGREISWFMNQYAPLPKVFIGYERVALVGREDPNLRVTFDRDLRWRTDRLQLQEGDDGKPVLSGERVIMEIKVASAMPLWLTGILSECQIYPQSFSKYGICYQKHLLCAQRQKLWMQEGTQGGIHRNTQERGTYAC